MKKRNVFFFIGALLLTATSVYQINHHPIVDSIIDQLKLKSDQEQDELVYLQMDRTFYRPGETIWFNAYVRNSDDHKVTGTSDILNIQFHRPNGTILDSFKLICNNGQAYGQLALPRDKGGIYSVKAFTNWQQNAETFFEKKIQVQQVLLPNLNMTLDFEKKSYGANDMVQADLTLEGLDNQELRYTSFKYKVNLSGDSFFEGEGRTDFEGKAKIRFSLPDSLSSSDGILNVMIPYRGLTESISRSIPIVLNDIDLAFFPEGGDWIAGHRTMMAFEALNEFGKPADISGIIENESGKIISRFSSLHNGMGKFLMFTNRTETYFAKITQPEGITKRYELPKFKQEGTTMNVFEQEKDLIKVSLQHTAPKTTFHIVAQAGDSIYYARTFENISPELGALSIPTKDFPVGIMRLTVFNNQKEAQCERLVFLNKHKQLNIEVTTDQETYMPREQVKLAIKITDEDGVGVSGNFSLAVTDDKLLTYADDKQGHILSKVLLEHELKGEIHEPNFYFDESEENADAALDLLMMTHGWRRFEWETVFEDSEDLATFSKERSIIAGTVVDSLGNGLANVQVTRTNAAQTVMTDEAGRFEFENVVLGYYGEMLRASIDQKNIGRITVNDYGNDYKITLTQQLGNLLGYLYDEEDKICKACTFEISEEKTDTKWRYQTDRKGAFSILNVSSGVYKIGLLNAAEEIVVSDTISILPFIDNWRNVFLSKKKQLDALTSRQAEIRREALQESWASKIDLAKLPPPDFQNANASKEAAGNIETGPIAGVIQRPDQGISLDMVMVTGYKVPLIEQDNTTQGGTLTSEQIRNLPTKDISALAATTAGLSQLDEGDPIYIRGSRSIATDYYVDGIRVTESGNFLPGISQIQIITGGIEAQYGGGPLRLERTVKPRNPKIPENENLKNSGPPNENSGLGNGFMVSGNSSINVGHSYRHYYKPSKVYAIPTDPALYKADCAECADLAEDREKQACHNAILLKEINQYVESYANYHYFRNLTGTSANIQFVVDKQGLVGDVVVIPDHKNDTRVISSLRSIVTKLNDWMPARHRGLRAATVHNIQVHYENKNAMKRTPYRQQRRFYSRSYYRNYKVKVRNDFRSTVYWNPRIQTNQNGEATLSFYNSDDITKMNIVVEGFAANGAVGRGEGDFAVVSPFNIITKIPTTVMTMDTIEFPITLVNNTDKVLTGDLNLTLPAFCKLNTTIEPKYSLKKKESKTLFLSLSVMDTTVNRYWRYVNVSFETKDYFDAVKKRIELLERGYPHHHTFTDVGLQNDFDLNIKNTYAGSIMASFKAHPNPMSEVVSAMEKMIRQPGGCFEQTSSSNYPNLLALQLMNKAGTGDAAIRKKANEFLDKGYRRLAGFESAGGGFSLFGRSASDPGLSAMGLMQFVDMKKVYPVEEALIARTAKWLMGDRDKNGGWTGRGCGYYNKTLQRDFYILWAMSEAGYGEKLKAELDRQYKIIQKNKDPYLMALICNALMLASDSRAEIVLEKLIQQQKNNGGWAGAERSVSYSRGKNLDIETTALALLAMTKNKKIHLVEEKKALHYLLKSKSRYGYGSTQGTVLTLKSISAFMDRHTTDDQSDGGIELLVNGELIKEFSYQKDQIKGISLDKIPALEKEGNHKIAVRFKDTKQPIPFEVEVTYTSVISQTNEQDCSIELTTEWSQQTAAIGETIRLTTNIENLTKDTVATPLAIIGIPGGMTVQPWQLKELQDKKVVEYYEIEEDRIVFYLNHMAPEASKTIYLDLKAELSGVFQSPASQAYLYYDNDAVSWAISDDMRIRQE